MKKALLLILCLSAMAAMAQVNVTFKVDMSEQTVSDSGVYIAGSFQDEAGFGNEWTPGTTALTDGDGDDIYELTVQLPTGSYEFKFLNGNNWGTEEGVPTACQVNSNRGFTVASNDTTIGPICFAKCDSCNAAVPELDTVFVTMQVNMKNEILLNGEPDSVTVAGNFQGAAGFSDWSPGQTGMTDVDGDGIYEVTVRIPEGTYQYKFVAGTAWGQDESVPSACAVSNNRQMVIGKNDTTLAPVCYRECAEMCTEVLPPVQVTFRVDMTNEFVSDSGLFVAGDFQNPAWDKASLKMEDPDGNGIYTYTASFRPGEYQYRYFNGNQGDNDAESADFVALGCGVDNGVGAFNRLLSIEGLRNDTVLIAYVYASCSFSTVSIDNALAKSFRMYPNPSNSRVSLEFQNPTQATYQLLVSNLAGQTVISREVKQGFVEIEKGNLPAGLYIVNLRGANGQQVTRKLFFN